jgi:hypothetical protein
VARHVRGHAVAAGHPCLASVVQETVRKILARDDVKPHKVRYYLERRDPAVETKMTEVLCVYREIAVLRAAEAGAGNVAIISWRSATLDFSTFLGASAANRGPPHWAGRRGSIVFPECSDDWL